MKTAANLTALCQRLSTLIQADSLCLWKETSPECATPLACYPANWQDLAFVIPAQQHASHFYFESHAALSHLPLMLRAKYHHQPPAALLIQRVVQPGSTYGVLAVWQDNHEVFKRQEQIQQLVDFAITLAFLHTNIQTLNDGISQHMRALAEVLPQGVIIIPANGQSRYINQNAARLLELERHDVSPDVLSQAMQNLFKKAVNSDELTHYIQRIINDQCLPTENHSHVWRFKSAPRALRVTIAAIKTHQTIGWLWLIEDVSAEIAYQDELVAQEQKFRHFYQNMQEAVISYDIQGNVIEANQRLNTLLQIGETQATQLTITNPLLGWTPLMWKSVLKACRDNLASPPYEKLLLLGDGSKIDVEAVAFSRKDPLGNILGIWEVSRDITLKKQVDAQLILSAQAFSHYSDGVILTDLHGTILTVNQAFSQAIGYSRDELRGKQPSIYQSGRHNSEFYRDLHNQVRFHGRWQGSIWNRKKNGDLLFQWLTINAVMDTDNQLTHYIGIYRDAATEAEEQNRIAYLASHDELTSLPNKILFKDRLEFAVLNARKNHQVLSIIMIGLDGFQNINNAVGYQFGDRVLKEVAVRLSNTIKEEDSIARMEGDRFAILLIVNKIEEIVPYCEQILTSINKPHDVNGVATVVPASMGISLFPSDGEDAQKLLLTADAALHQAKKHDRNNYRFYTSDLMEKFTQRFNIENGLRIALKQQQLFLQYQPQITADSSHIHGCEALLRWRQGDKIISPAAFIPIAEESGLIIPITEWVLREVCLQLKRWDEKGLWIETVSVNISARHFMRYNMVSNFTSILHETGIDSKRICLEITEGILADAIQSEQKLRQLKNLGFMISVDDFGTGFSSLSYLKRFQLDEIKIDKSFIDGISVDDSGRAIVCATLLMAHSLDMHVVAEGVETQQQLDYLKNNGCETIQGYYFSKPLLADDLEHFAVCWNKTHPCASAVQQGQVN
jgi:diguanylate cyclase (GGDEF)-like protein/PAS domain S-box-containing protein